VHLAPVRQRLLVDLGHLADLLVERHLLDEPRHVGRRQARLALGGYVGLGDGRPGAGLGEAGERRERRGCRGREKTTTGRLVLGGHGQAY
jgi:hypothetical protein